MATDDDTFTVSAHMARLEFKIQSYDLDKIAQLKELVRHHVNIEKLIEGLR